MVDLKDLQEPLNVEGASEYLLKRHGISCSATRLITLASQTAKGDGPIFRKAGGIALYHPADLDRYAARILNPPPMAKQKTLREWFAGRALSGLLAEQNHSLNLPIKDVVAVAYMYADEMIAQRRDDNSAGDGI